MCKDKKEIEAERDAVDRITESMHSTEHATGALIRFALLTITVRRATPFRRFAMIRIELRPRAGPGACREV